eukprot:363324-Chlamydomonas_euryale.AAC.24
MCKPTAASVDDRRWCISRRPAVVHAQGLWQKHVRLALRSGSRDRKPDDLRRHIRLRNMGAAGARLKTTSGSLLLYCCADETRSSLHMRSCSRTDASFVFSCLRRGVPVWGWGVLTGASRLSTHAHVRRRAAGFWKKGGG